MSGGIPTKKAKKLMLDEEISRGTQATLSNEQTHKICEVTKKKHRWVWGKEPEVVEHCEDCGRLK